MGYQRRVHGGWSRGGVSDGEGSFFAAFNLLSPRRRLLLRSKQAIQEWAIESGWGKRRKASFFQSFRSFQSSKTRIVSPISLHSWTAHTESGLRRTCEWRVGAMHKNGPRTSCFY